MRHNIDKITIVLDIDSEESDSQTLHNSIVEPFKTKTVKAIENVLERFHVEEKITIEKIQLEINSHDENDFLAELQQKLAGILTGHINHTTGKALAGLYQNHIETGMSQFLRSGFFTDRALQQKWLEPAEFDFFERKMLEEMNQRMLTYLNLFMVNEQTLIRLLHFFPGAAKKIKAGLSYLQHGNTADIILLLQSLAKHQVITTQYAGFCLTDDACNEWLLSVIQKTALLSEDIGEKISFIQRIINNDPSKYKKSARALYEIQQKAALYAGQKKAMFSEQTGDEDIAGHPVQLSPVTGTEEFEGLFFPVGILFFHPYMADLFNALQLLKDRRFISVAAQIKAVTVLKTISSGNRNITEQEMFFYKIACGLDPEIFIDPAFDLTKKEKKIIHAYLVKFIREWRVLKSTSVETLQMHFLNRMGSVHISGHQVIIKMQPSVFDILLEEYPWNLGVIKLPWLKKIISTEIGRP